MLTLLFAVGLFVVFGNLFRFAIRATWSIFKMIGIIFFLPVILFVMFFMGLFYIALPVLLIVGIITMVCNIASV